MIKFFFILFSFCQRIILLDQCQTFLNNANNDCYVAYHNNCKFVDTNNDVQTVSNCNDYCQMNDAQLDCAICYGDKRYSNKVCSNNPNSNNGQCYNYITDYWTTSYQDKCDPNCWALCPECTYYHYHYHCRFCDNLSGQLYNQSGRNCYNVTTVSNCWVIEGDSDCKICNDNYMMNQDQKTCSQVDTSISNCLNFDKFQCKICKNTHQFNRNYYAVLFDQPNLTSHDSFFLQDFLYTSYRMKNQLVSQCEPIQTIQNCAIYLTGIKCRLCDKSSGLIPSSDMLSCIDPFRLFVEFCEIYNIEQVGCKICLQGYYLLNGLCKRVDEVSNCIHYNLNTCDQCSINYKLVNGSCTLRSLISNCSTYEYSEDYCSQCNSSYSVSEDKLSCISTISNCKVHVSSIFGSPVCKQCNDYYYVNFFNQCTYGSISNCQIYKTQGYNQCDQCQNQYYLQSSTSCVYDPIDNCQLHDYFKENVCTECNIEYVLLDKYTPCQSINTINQCAEYEYSDKCKLCNDYYYLNEQKTQCNSIDSSVNNCKQYNPTDGCVKCEDSYSILNGKCILNNEYFESCDLSDFYGELFNNYQCKRCIIDYAPVDLTDYYGCHSYAFMYEKGLTNPDSNCLKYGYDVSSLTFVCELCKDGFYIRNGQCLTSCESNELLFKYTITKVQIPFTLNYNYIKYQSENVCGQLVDQEPNCIQVVPDVFFQSTDYRKVNYSCIECSSDSIRIPKVKSVVNEYTPNINLVDGRLTKNPLKIFPGLSCQNKSGIKIEGILSNGLIDGCEYYVQLGFNESTGDTSYGCLKCEFGKNGIIERHQSSNKGYIKECKDFELPEEELNALDGVCNTARFMFGFTHNSNDVNWNQVPLETYLSCHDCISPSFPFYLFLFISFEDISKFSIGTQFSYKKNNMKNHSMLLDYQMPNDPTPGRTLRCLTFDLDKIFNFEDPIPNTIIEQMFFTDYLVKCQLFIVNSLKYKYVLNTYKPNPEILKEIIYCGACKPGFKATKFSPLDSGESEITGNEYFFPYKVFNCIEISNCNLTSGDWVNNCEICKDDYTWYWNNTKKTIEYDQCVFNNHQNCIAVDDNGLCQVCKKGFEFLDGKCVLFLGNKCEDTETLFVRNYPVNSDHIDFAKNYFYVRNKTRGCNKCENDTSLADNLRYVSFLNIPTTLNRSQRIHCLTNCQNQCDKDVSLWEKVVFLPNCKYYRHITYQEYNGYGEEKIKIKCHECETGYVLNTILECMDATGFDNCYMVDTDNNTCIQCDDGYYFENGNCILPNIPQCQTYDNYPSSTSLICSKCNDYYYLNTNTNTCVSGSIPNCRVYESQTMCEICNDDYQNYKIGNIKTECIQLKSEFNCLKLNYDKFLDNIFECEKCIDNHIGYVSTNIDPEETMCFDHPSVTNCIKYNVQQKNRDSTFQCEECSNSYYLDVTNNTCLSRTANYTYCTTRIIDQDKCELCYVGYSLTADQRNCLPNEVQISGCALYYRERLCLECQNRYYLENNTCIFVETQFVVQSCIRYEKTTSIKCSRCAPLYFLDPNDGQCKVGLVSNCEQLTDKTNCKYCMENFQLYLKPNIDPNLQGTYECKLLETATNRPLNCEESDIVQPSICKTCIDNTYAKNGVCTVVLAADKVNNCLKYELNDSNNVVCYLCEVGYYKYWVTNKYTCVQSSTQVEQPDAVHNDCRQLEKTDLAICNSCPRNYHFDWDNDFQTCVSNSSSTCAIIRERDPGSCNSCADGRNHDGNNC